MSGPNRRRQLLINPRFQLSFIGYNILIAITVAGVFFSAQATFFRKFLDAGRELGLSHDHLFFRYIAEQQTALLGLTLVAALIVTLIIVVSGLFISHKISGPVLKLNNHMREIADSGAFKEVKFRKGDFFPELADSFNALVSKKKDS